MKTALLSVLALVTSLCVTFANGTITTSKQGDIPQGEAEEAAQPGSSKEVVKPGETHDNGDCVVKNTGDDGNINVNPGKGASSSSTTIMFKNGAEGAVTGLDSNDTVNLGSNAIGQITGTGGTIHCQGDSSGTVTNTGSQGGPNMTVHLVGGAIINVPPGSAIGFAN